MNKITTFFFILVTIICGQVSVSWSQASMSGPLGAKTVSQALSYFDTVPAATIQNIIAKYARYAPSAQTSTHTTGATNLNQAITAAAQKGSFNAIVQERALLLEAFFVHFGILTGLQVAPGVDNTKSAMINSSSILQVGTVVSNNTGSNSSKNISETLPHCCARLCNVSRYIRGFGNLINLNVKTIKTTPLDSFYGVILLNGGWFGSKTQQPNFYSAGGVQRNNVYWIKAGAYVVANQATGASHQVQSFIEQDTAGIARVAGGIDSWPAVQGKRVLSFVFSDQSGSDALSSTQQPVQIQLSQQGNNIVIEQVDNEGVVTTVPLSVQAQKLLKNCSSLPWALVAEVTNSKPTGGESLVPLVKITAIVQLNPYDFPLSYQMPQSSIVAAPFLFSTITDGFEFFTQQVEKITPATQSDYSCYFKLGTCDEYTFKITASSTNESGMYIPPLPFAVVKYQGALQYGWGAKTALKDALTGIDIVMKQIFMTKDMITLPQLLQQIDGIEQVGASQKVITRNPSFALL